MSDFTHLKPHKILRALTLSGGGVRGLLPIKILADLETVVRASALDSFDLFCGTSIGGILCLGLAVGNSPSDLTNIFKDRAGEIFGKPRRMNPFGIRGSKHDPSGLRAVIKDVLGNDGTRKLSQLGKPVVIVSVNISTNSIEYFGNVPDVHGIRCKDAPLLDVAMATSAAPFFFPPHKIGEDYFADGGIVSNNPDLEALMVGLEHFARTQKSMKILSLGTGRHRPLGPSESLPNPGSRSWLKKMSLVDRLIQLQEEKPSIVAASQLGSNYQRIDIELDRNYELDNCSEESLAALLDIAATTSKRIMQADSGRIAGFFR